MHFTILKMIATSGFVRALECTKFVFAPDRAERAYSAPLDHLAGLRGTLFLTGRGEGEDGREEGTLPS